MKMKSEESQYFDPFLLSLPPQTKGGKLRRAVSYSVVAARRQ